MSDLKTVLQPVLNYVEPFCVGRVGDLRNRMVGSNWARRQNCVGGCDIRERKGRNERTGTRREGTTGLSLNLSITG